LDFPHLSSVSKRRKTLGLTQQQLARLCDIGQSFLAKVERGRAMPSYEIAVKLFTELDRQESKNLAGQLDLKAEDIMVSKVITVGPGESANDARKIMLEKNISQLPVVDAKTGFSEGSITEQSLLGKEANDKTVRELMDKEVFPSVSRNTKMAVIVSILKEQEQQAILVVEKGRNIGIITKYDVIANAGKALQSK